MSIVKPDTSGPRHVDLWTVLSSADDVGQFMNAWLHLTCTALPEIQHGVVFAPSEHNVPARPVARWMRPGATVDIEAISEAARRLITADDGGREGLVECEGGDVCHAALNFAIRDRSAGGVVVETGPLSSDGARRLLRHLQWSQAWVEAFYRRRQEREDAGLADRARRLLDMVAVVVQRTRFDDAARTFAGALQVDLDVQRVAVGLDRRGRVEVEALAQSATIEKSMSLIRALGDAMAEAVDQQSSLLFCREDHPDRINALASASLARLGGAASILVLPMPLDADVVGAVTLERFDDNPFGQAEIDLADALVTTVTPILMDKRERSRGVLSILLVRLSAGLGWLIGPRALGWKLAALALTCALAASLLLTTEHRVTAETVVQGEVRRVLSAPFDGYVETAYARAGELVSEGDLLAELDDSDLQLDRLRIIARRQQHQLELDRATGTRDLAEINIVRAQMAQDNAELALVEDQLARTKIAAPFDGVVVQGDLSQTIGQPVSRGDSLFELAPLDDYRVIALVPEGDIDLVQTGAGGRLLLASLPEEAFPFEVDTIAPIARAAEGINGFEAVGRFRDPTGRVRPGMEGVARIDAGDRSYAHIWTRGLIRWLRLRLWSVIP